MLKLIGKLAKFEEQKSQGKLTFTFKNISDELREDLLQYEGQDGFLLFHIDRIRKEVADLIESKKGFIDDLGSSPSKKMMIALKNRWVKIKDQIGMEWEEYYPHAIDQIIKRHIENDGGTK